MSSIFFLSILLLLQNVPGDQDVVRLRDGTTRSGRILSESRDDVVLETLIKGAKGQVVGTVKVTIARDQIQDIDRTTPEARRLAEARSKNFGERGTRRFEALNRIVPTAVRFQGLQGFRVTGTHYVLESSCDAAFVKDVALSLEEVFAAYERYFGVRRNGEQKVKVLMFADRLEYEFYNLHAADGKVSAVAYYRPSDNTIAAYNMIQKEKEQLIRTEIRNAQEDLDKFRTRVSAAEKQIAAMMPALRQQITDDFNERRRLILTDDKGAKDRRLADLDNQEKQAVDDLKNGKDSVVKELQDAKRAANAELEKARQLIEHNEDVLLAQNRAVFETIFHEAFHAFAATYLWKGSGEKEFPRWLHEGMACYFETATIEGVLLVHGAPHPGFLRLMREKQMMRTTLPVEKIIRGGPEEFMLVHPTEAGRRTDYYAGSWALAHYLALRVTREQLEAYVNDVLAGKDPVAAFERLTGKSCAQLELDLKAHLDALK
ncbi:MAG TPA: DUF1570 domain-containing protein [Planctomycetota bacterium]|nr:DUF1570 domain-containing protein [Planctomycetota bacterium]